MRILVLGAGKMGRGAVYDLTHNSPDVQKVTIADTDAPLVKIISELYGEDNCTGQQIDVTDYANTLELMREHDAVISCVPYFYNLELAKTALDARVNFCDLGGNNDVANAELALDDEAKAAGINIIPDCGLAPGMVSILAMHGAASYESLDSIKIRVGGLPQTPQPPLDYQLIFSVEGLINEYVEPARVLRNGQVSTIDSLTEIEELEFSDFGTLEAFHTSGGVSTLPETFLGKVNNLDYKTIRYRGHCEKIKTLIDLGFAATQPILVSTARSGNKADVAPRSFLTEMLKRNLPRNEPDVVLIRLEFRGANKGSRQMLRYDIVDRFDHEADLTAMMRTTSFPASIIAQMMVRGDISAKGAMPQEIAVSSSDFIAELARRRIIITEETFSIGSNQ